jgi:hypothetical protein
VMSSMPWYERTKSELKGRVDRGIRLLASPFCRGDGNPELPEWPSG